MTQSEDGLTPVHNIYCEVVTYIDDRMVSQRFTVSVPVVNRCELSTRSQTCRCCHPLRQHVYDGTGRDWMAAYPFELNNKNKRKLVVYFFGKIGSIREVGRTQV